MPDIVFSALSTALLLVRFIKGPWMRYPQYVAAALVGALVAGLLLAKFAPDIGSSFLIGGLSGFGGAWIGIIAFDTLFAG
jgi:hypothetical protein